MLVHMCIYQGRPSVAFQDPAAVAFRGGQRTTSGCKCQTKAHAPSAASLGVCAALQMRLSIRKTSFRAPLAESGGERDLESLWQRANFCLLMMTMGVAEESREAVSNIHFVLSHACSSIVNSKILRSITAGAPLPLPPLLRLPQRLPHYPARLPCSGPAQHEHGLQS
jgi:hypothetical protein